MKYHELIETLMIFQREDDTDYCNLIPGREDNLWIGTTDLVPEDSKDGKRLKELGWDVDEGYWHRYV